jgi:hypothetical protein
LIAVNTSQSAALITLSTLDKLKGGVGIGEPPPNKYGNSLTNNKHHRQHTGKERREEDMRQRSARKEKKKEAGRGKGAKETCVILSIMTSC